MKKSLFYHPFTAERESSVSFNSLVCGHEILTLQTPAQIKSALLFGTSKYMEQQCWINIMKC